MRPDWGTNMDHVIRPRFLMCRPEHYTVSYAINPWMDPARWARDARAHRVAVHEWDTLYQKLIELGAAVELVPPAQGVPDLVFTANAAVVLDRRALLARFRHEERGREEPHFEAAFRVLQARGLISDVRKLPAGIVLEGAGDCVFDAARDLFWMGYGPRSDIAAAGSVAEMFSREVVALELADPRFYHMDTALCPLPGGEVMYLAGAFTAEGLRVIRGRVEPSDRIEIGIEDGSLLAANAVCIGRTIVMSAASEALRADLRRRGYEVAVIPLGSFLRSGGSAFCLTLRLDRSSVPALATSPRRAVA
jgi:N-dimethylarginine dimethylaminohydrolase